MTVLEALAVVAAGAVAGGVNAVVGSGSLITFPTLLAVGYAPVTANVSNSIGLVPGGVSGAIGYRAELRGQGRRTAKRQLKRSGTVRVKARVTFTAEGAKSGTKSRRLRLIRR